MCFVLCFCYHRKVNALLMFCSYLIFSITRVGSFISTGEMRYGTIGLFKSRIKAWFMACDRDWDYVEIKEISFYKHWLRWRTRNDFFKKLNRHGKSESQMYVIIIFIKPSLKKYRKPWDIKKVLCIRMCGFNQIFNWLQNYQQKIHLLCFKIPS